MTSSAASPAYALAIPGQNRILDCLSKADRAAILAMCEEIPMEIRKGIYEQDGPLKYGFFPSAGIVSSTVQLSDGPMVEVSVTGAEGFVGIPLLLGSRKSPNLVFTQVEGHLLRISAADLLDQLKQRPAFKTLMLLYANAMWACAGQLAVCNRLHEAEERLSRWLLTVQDRLASDDLPLTHEFLALMLGTRRATVTIAAGLLQRAGAIRYSRGHIRVLDRAQLEEAACECYRRTRLYVDQVFRGGVD